MDVQHGGMDGYRRRIEHGGDHLELLPSSVLPWFSSVYVVHPCKKFLHQML